MTKKINSFKVKPITLIQQQTNIKLIYRDFTCSIKRHCEMVVNGFLTPTPLSKTYAFKIVYKINKPKKVVTTVEGLTPRIEGERIPHTYPDGSICLYKPIYNEFGPEKYIGETIIPWLSFWLYCYEIWKATGDMAWDFNGCGEHPKHGQKK